MLYFWLKYYKEEVNVLIVKPAKDLLRRLGYGSHKIPTYEQTFVTKILFYRSMIRGFPQIRKPLKIKMEKEDNFSKQSFPDNAGKICFKYRTRLAQQNQSMPRAMLATLPGSGSHKLR